MVQRTQSNALLSPLDNLIGFTMTRPPCIVFMVCLGLISVILMTLAFIVKDKELKNPDISQDWNVFMDSFAQLEFCIHGNTSHVMTTAMPLKIPEPMHTTTPSAESSYGIVSPTSHLSNYSVSMLLNVLPTLDFVSIPHNLTFLTGTITGSQIGLTGLAADEPILITMQLPYEWNNTDCRSSGHGCQMVKIYTCVLFQAADNVFPSGRSPDVCESINDTGVVYQAVILADKPPTISYRCRSKPIIQIKNKLDPTLTVMLSLSDRSVINLHLLHTSYFLFVMTITILLYATLRGRPVKYKMTHAASLSTSTSSTI